MRLRALVSGLPANWIPRPAPFPESCRVAEAARAVTTHAAWRDLPLLDLPEIALASLKQQLLQCHRSGDWSSLLPRDWRYANECLTLGPLCLLDDPDFLSAYLTALAERRSKGSSANLLARWYVRNFDPDHPGVRQIGASLAEYLRQTGARWAALHRDFGLFDPQAAVSALARALDTASTTPADTLRSLHFPPSLLSSRLFGYVFAAVCRRAAAAPPRGLDWVNGITAWAFGSGDLFQHTAIPGAMAAYAEAMLLPWAQKFPGEAIRSLVVTRLLGLMMDPRTNPAGWAEVREAARKVMLGWMIKDALEQFMEVVDETVQTHQRKMWAERRHFWSFFYDQQYIHECWVVFGRRGAALARHIATSSNNQSLMNFGGFIGDVGGDPNQAVLMMRIGKMLIADWSHNARCYIWLPGNPAAPPFYQNEYLRSDLMTGADFETPHHRSWQDSVYEFILGHLPSQTG